jgi:hypothetical protein
MPPSTERAAPAAHLGLRRRPSPSSAMPAGTGPAGPMDGRYAEGESESLPAETGRVAAAHRAGRSHRPESGGP